MMTEEFQTFFNKTTRVVERALDEEIDIFVDYAGGESEDMERYVDRMRQSSQSSCQITGGQNKKYVYTIIASSNGMTLPINW